MGIPANIVSQIAFLQTQTTAAAPLSSASPATIVAIQLNAENLVASVDAAVLAAAGALDTWEAPTDPDLIVSGILALEQSATDQSALAVMRGYVGRMAANLNQL